MRPVTNRYGGALKRQILGKTWAPVVQCAKERECPEASAEPRHSDLKRITAWCPLYWEGGLEVLQTRKAFKKVVHLTSFRFQRRYRIVLAENPIPLQQKSAPRGARPGSRSDPSQFLVRTSNDAYVG